MMRTGFVLMLLWLVAGAAPAGAQTIGYAQAIDLLAANCGNDIAKYCKQANLGGGRVQRCLAQNQDKISARCKSATVAVPKVCDVDIRRLCAGVVAGDGNLLECFMKAEARASAPCRQAVIDAGYR
jgi:hypothetical protein